MAGQGYVHPDTWKGKTNVGESTADRCPKCGFAGPFNGPNFETYVHHYQHVGHRCPDVPVIRECLAYTCPRCHWKRTEATLDAPPERPPDSEVTFEPAGGTWLRRLWTRGGGG